MNPNRPVIAPLSLPSIAASVSARTKIKTVVIEIDSLGIDGRGRVVFEVRGYKKEHKKYVKAYASVEEAMLAAATMLIEGSGIALEQAVLDAAKQSAGQT